MQRPLCVGTCRAIEMTTNTHVALILLCILELQYAEGKFMEFKDNTLFAPIQHSQ